AGVEMSFQQQLIMMLTLMLTSKGVAAVPRASLVILAGTLAPFPLPLGGGAGILRGDGLVGMGPATGEPVRQRPAARALGPGGRGSAQKMPPVSFVVKKGPKKSRRGNQIYWKISPRTDPGSAKRKQLFVTRPPICYAAPIAVALAGTRREGFSP